MRPETDEAEGFAGDLGSHHVSGAPAGPVVAPHMALAFADPAGDGEEKGDGEIGGGVGQDVRGCW